MKRTPAVALSLFLAPFLSLMTAAAYSASSERCEGCIAQPGRLETAREIKTEADVFVIQGRILSHKLNDQILEAARLKSEAVRLQAEANRLSQSGVLIAQQSTPSAPAESKSTEAKTTSGDEKTQTSENKPAAEVKPEGASGGEGGGNPKPAEAGKKEEKLTGRASQLQTVAPPNIPLIKLKGPQLQQALSQFNTDVDQFKIHAADYNKHLNMFRSQIGECQAAKHAFDDLHKKYEMHCDAYHLNNIPPPHLCLEMNVSASEASSIANQLMNDQMRALRAEAQLNAEEGKLRQLEGMQGKADTLVVKASDRARREKEIAGMFGRLRQEYELLEIERKTIEASKGGGGKPTAPVVRPYVSGKIKKK